MTPRDSVACSASPKALLGNHALWYLIRTCHSPQSHYKLISLPEFWFMLAFFAMFTRIRSHNIVFGVIYLSHSHISCSEHPVHIRNTPLKQSSACHFSSICGRMLPIFAVICCQIQGIPWFDLEEKLKSPWVWQQKPSSTYAFRRRELTEFLGKLGELCEKLGEIAFAHE